MTAGYDAGFREVHETSTTLYFNWR